MRRTPLLLMLPIALGACFEESLGGSGEATPTLVAVAPDDFLGEIPCAPAAGGMQTYVATLSEVSGDLDGAGEFTLPSSEPLGCTRTVAFGFVVPGLAYVADVDGYDRADLRPLAPGSRVLLGPDGQPVAPRWTTSCGRGAERTEATLSLPNRTVRVTRCEPLATEGGAQTTGLVIPLAALAPCGAEPRFARFAVARRGGAAREAACGERIEWLDVVADRPEFFDVLAFAAGAVAPSAGTTCAGVPRDGALVEATCDPLASDGALSIDMGRLVAEAGQSCGVGGFTSASATVTTSAGRRSIGPVTACGRLEARELPPGVAAAVVVVERGDGATATTTCDALIAPGAVATAECAPLRLP